jgi:hypothetical protein
MGIGPVYHLLHPDGGCKFSLQLFAEFETPKPNTPSRQTLLVYSAIIHGIVVGMNKNGHGPLMFALKMSVHNLLNVTPAEDDQGSDTSVASKA